MNVEYLKGPIRVFSGPICTESGRRVDQDRTRRALSDGLFIFLSRLLHDTEKPKKKICSLLKESHRFAQKVDQGLAIMRVKVHDRS
jgi:hypothetical protein